MARETLFETQALSFVLSDFGYMYQTTPSPFVLTAGESYIIVWEGQEYVRTAWAFDSLAPGTVGVGSTLPAGGEADPDGLPVTFGYIPATDYAAIFSLEGEGPYSVGLYKEIAEPARLILRDPDGTEQEYPMRSMLEVDTTEGGTVLYSKGQILDGLTIQPDFSDGDMEITAPDGYLVKSAVVAKPENLVPENIKKNEVVAGIVGTHEGGGGGGAVPCVLTRAHIEATKVYSTSTSISKTVSCELPLDSEIKNIMYGNQISETSSSSTKSTVYTQNKSISGASSGFLDANGVSITQTETVKTVSVTGTAFGSSTNKYKLHIFTLIVSFTLPGLYCTSNDDGTVDLYADEAVTELPANGALPPNARKIDLSNSSITTLPRYCINDTAEGAELILPATLTSIAVGGIWGALGTGSVIDFSRATAIPTINTDALKKGATILVPASLYDEWIAATNWSYWADYIVAV